MARMHDIHATQLVPLNAGRCWTWAQNHAGCGSEAVAWRSCSPTRSWIFVCCGRSTHAP